MDCDPGKFGFCLFLSDSALFMGDGEVINLINSIGGILLGCAISMLATLITTDSPITTPYFIVMLVSGIVGAFLLGIYLIK